MNELLQKLQACDDQLDQLLASDELTPDQKAEHDALVEQRTGILAAIDKHKRVQAEAAERRVQAQARADERAALEREAAQQAAIEEQRRLAALPKPGTNRKTTADVPHNGQTVRTTKDAVGATVSYMEETDESVSLRVGDGREAVQRLSYRKQKRQNIALLKASGYQPCGQGGVFTSVGDFIRQGFQSNGQASFNDQVRRHYAAVSGMSEGAGADGGYTVMPEFANGIIDRVYSNDLWGRTDNYSINGNNMTFQANAETSRANGSRHGGMRGYWLAEGATLTKSKPTFREVTLKLVKLGVLVYLTDELLADTGTALEQYVARKAAEEFNFMIGDSLINGTGVGQPLGILNAPALLSIAKEAGQAAATLETENIVKMNARFYPPNLSNAVWTHNQDILPELHTMTIGVGTGGHVTYMPPGGLSGAPYATLMGRPMLPTEFNATLGTQGDLILADFGQILSISKGGVAQAVSMHVEFLTDQLALRFIMRLNATPWETTPTTQFKGTATQSSFVTLDSRS